MGDAGEAHNPEGKQHEPKGSKAWSLPCRACVCLRRGEGRVPVMELCGYKPSAGNIFLLFKKQEIPEISTAPVSLPKKGAATGSAGQTSVPTTCHLRSISTPRASPNERFGLERAPAVPLPGSPGAEAPQQQQEGQTVPTQATGTRPRDPPRNPQDTACDGELLQRGSQLPDGGGREAPSGAAGGGGRMRGSALTPRAARKAARANGEPIAG